MIKRLFCKHKWELLQKTGSWREVDVEVPYISGTCAVDGYICKKCGKFKIKCYGDNAKKHNVYSKMKKELIRKSFEICNKAEEEECKKLF